MRRGKLAYGKAVARERLEDLAPRAVRQRGEHGIERIVRILNHKVKYQSERTACQALRRMGG